MQKYTEPCINTGSFAKLCNTNKRTLIHYDEIGLFKPAYTDERGYRYYSETQCDVFFTITCLKDLGMPLNEIKRYVNHQNPEDLTALLLEQQKKVQQNLLHLKRIEQVIHNKLNLVSEGIPIVFDEQRCSAPMLKQLPEEHFAITPVLNTGRHEILFAALCEHISQINRQELNIGHPYGAIMKVSDLQSGIFDRYIHFMTRISAEEDPSFRKTDPDTSSADLLLTQKNLPVHQKTSGLYAVIYLQGDYYEADAAFHKLLTFLQDHSFQPGEYCYKEAVWDELTVDHKRDYITRISIPVFNCKKANCNYDTSILK